MPSDFAGLQSGRRGISFPRFGAFDQTEFAQDGGEDHGLGFDEVQRMVLVWDDVLYPVRRQQGFRAEGFLDRASSVFRRDHPVLFAMEG